MTIPIKRYCLAVCRRGFPCECKSGEDPPGMKAVGLQDALRDKDYKGK